MKLIAHRGNINGKAENAENRPIYIESAILLGYEVEVDIWFVDNKFWLGHDAPEYPVTDKWILKNANHLWFHCKNVDAVNMFLDLDIDGGGFQYFWHENDRLSITSQGYIWTCDVSITGPNVVWMITNEGPMDGSGIGNPDIYGVCADNLSYFEDLTDS